MPAPLFNARSRAGSCRSESRGSRSGPYTRGSSFIFSNLLVVAISWSYLGLGHKGAYRLGSRPSADGQTPTTAKVVMFLIHDPYIPPRHKRQLFELVARAGSRIKRAFRLCRACFPLTKGSSYLGCFDDEFFCYQTPKAQSLGSRVGIRCITKNTGGPL